MLTLARLVLALVLAAAATLCVHLWVNEGPLWRMVMVQRTGIVREYKGHGVRGWKTKHRWGNDHASEVTWYVETGMKLFEGTYEDGILSTGTYWKLDGEIDHQHAQWRWPGDEREMRTSPPCCWGVTVQTDPTAPWWGKE